MIADTDFLVDLMRKKSREAISKLNELEDEEVFLTSVTVFELWHGTVMASNYQNEARRVAELVNEFPVLLLDSRSARTAGIISGDLHKKGLRVEPADCMIAGIAMTNRQRLITRNIKHFGRIRGLEIEPY